MIKNTTAQRVNPPNVPYMIIPPFRINGNAAPLSSFNSIELKLFELDSS
jgi:hypothetical protein